MVAAALRGDTFPEAMVAAIAWADLETEDLVSVCSFSGCPSGIVSALDARVASSVAEARSEASLTRTNSLFTEADLARSTGRTFADAGVVFALERVCAFAAATLLANTWSGSVAGFLVLKGLGFDVGPCFFSEVPVGAVTG